jgi:hypothetical protein
MAASVTRLDSGDESSTNQPCFLLIERSINKNLTEARREIQT